MEFETQLKTGQHIPLRTIEQVTEDYSKVSHELAQEYYKKHIAEKEIEQYTKKITELLAKMKDLNIEGNKIYKAKEKQNGQKITQ